MFLADKDRLVIQARVDVLQDQMNVSMQDEKNHHAEYVLCWLPLGGYVRMLDEREAAVRPADLPHAFNRQTLGKRAAIVAAGPAANALLAVVLYAAVQWIGVSAVAPVLASPPPDSLAAEAGLRARDHVRAVQVGTGTEQAVDSLESLRWPHVDLSIGVFFRKALAERFDHTRCHW